jgi:hypothetical protein
MLQAVLAILGKKKVSFLFDDFKKKKPQGIFHSIFLFQKPFCKMAAEKFH